MSVSKASEPVTMLYGKGELGLLVRLAGLETGDLLGYPGGPKAITRVLRSQRGSRGVVGEGASRCNIKLALRCGKGPQAKE